MKKLLYLTIPLLLTALPLFPQDFSADRQMYRSGDILQKKQVEFPRSLVSEGSEKITAVNDKQALSWDFSALQPVNEDYQVIFEETDEGGIRGIEHQTAYHYRLSGDTLLLDGYTGQTIRMDYTQAEPLLIFPLREGQSFETTFSGEGCYSGKMKLNTAGNIRLMTGQSGKLVLPGGEVLSEVLPVVSIKQLAQQVTALSPEEKIKEAMTGKKEEIATTREEKANAEKTREKLLRDSKDGPERMQLVTIRWYMKGARYPVFETMESTGWKDGQSYTHFRTAFAYSPLGQQQELAFDPENRQVLMKTAMEEENFTGIGETTREPLYSFTTDRINGVLTLSLHLQEPSQVSVLISDTQGKVRVRLPEENIRQGNSSREIEIKSLSTGTYILTIIINGNPYSGKFIR